MKIGYACICLDPQFHFETCIQKFATESRLRNIIRANLATLQKLLEYNAGHSIRMYRLSSDLIPFGSSPVNTIPWLEEFAAQFQSLGDYVREHGMRVSLHPGQYCVINSPREEVVTRSIDELLYHASILEAMGLDATHKMILHVGGIYGDKQQAMQRFARVYRRLDPIIQKHLIIENDDRYYTIEDVLYLSVQLSIPVVFDNLHHAILPPALERSQLEWLWLVADTWKKEDGIMKIHFCQQDVKKRKGAHAMHIDADTFLEFIREREGLDMDIMLEVKDKNISAIKCRNLLEKTLQDAQAEWKRYRLLFLLDSTRLYEVWNTLMHSSCGIQSLDFYHVCEDIGRRVHTASDVSRMLQHVIQNTDWTQRTANLLLRAVTAYEAREKSLEQLLDTLLRACEREQRYDLYDAVLLLKTYEV